MTDRIMIKLNNVTKSATVDQIKYWCKLLDIQPTIISRAAHVTAEQCEIIKKMADLINQGTRPGEAASMLANTSVTISPVAKKELNPELLNRIESLEKVVMLLVEQNQKLVTTIELQNESQNKKLESIQLQLETPKTEIKIFKAWEPEAKKKPEFPRLKKFWYELTDPARLRAN